MNQHGRIEHQYNSTFCSAFSTSSYLTAYFNRIYGKQLEFSTLYLAKLLGIVDKGGNLSTLFSKIEDNGCCELSYYQDSMDKDWNDGKYPPVPQQALDNAKLHIPFKKKALARKERTVSRIKELIRNNSGCVWTINCFPTYHDKYKKMFVRPPKKNEESVGRHGIYVCGYDDALTCTYDGQTYTGFFVYAESYGTLSPSRGYCYIPYAFVTELIHGYYSSDTFLDDVYYYEYETVPAFNTINDTILPPSAESTVQLKIGANIATVDGRVIKLSHPAITEDNRTLVPLRFLLGDVFGASVSFDDSTKKITAYKNEPNFLLTAYLNNRTIVKKGYGQTTTIIADVPPRAYNGTTLVPLRVISELLECKVMYDKGLITIKGCF